MRKKRRNILFLIIVCALLFQFFNHSEYLQQIPPSISQYMELIPGLSEGSPEASPDDSLSEDPETNLPRSFCLVLHHRTENPALHGMKLFRPIPVSHGLPSTTESPFLLKKRSVRKHLSTTVNWILLAAVVRPLPMSVRRLCLQSPGEILV